MMETYLEMLILNQYLFYLGQKFDHKLYLTISQKLEETQHHNIKHIKRFFMIHKLLVS